MKGTNSSQMRKKQNQGGYKPEKKPQKKLYQAPESAMTTNEVNAIMAELGEEAFI